MDDLLPYFVLTMELKKLQLRPIMRIKYSILMLGDKYCCPKARQAPVSGLSAAQRSINFLLSPDIPADNRPQRFHDTTVAIWTLDLLIFSDIVTFYDTSTGNGNTHW